MEDRIARKTRRTKETEVTVILSFLDNPTISVATDLPFFNHLLTAMAFHGHFSLNVKAAGDVHVDPHHLVEDTALVLGDALKSITKNSGPLTRFGHSVIPMDDSLAEVVIDVCERPFLVYNADFPQTNAGDFDIFLLREFLFALVNRAGITLHANIRYGQNSHHMAEALFKALGKAIFTAYTPVESRGEIRSTKGIL